MFFSKCYSCNFVFLKSVKKDRRKFCCSTIREFEQLYLDPLPPVLRQYALSHIPHLSPNSANYNSLLSIASTGVDNGLGGGYERIRGDHSVTLRGRTYHYLGDPTAWRGGIHYFTHDAVEAVVRDGESLNTRTRQKIIPQILSGSSQYDASLKNFF